jgi:hypothetical protein
VMKQTIVFDFDGVINSYVSGWLGKAEIPDAPVLGIGDVISELRRDYKVVVQSARCSTPNGRRAVQEYLEKWNIEVDEVTAEKPPALVYIDDRALLFDGNPSTLAQRIREFQPWHKRKKEGDSLGSKIPWKGKHPQQPLDTIVTRRNEYYVIKNWAGRYRYAVAVWDDGSLTYERLPDAEVGATEE